MLPWLTDSTEQLDHALGLLAEAGAAGATVFPLHLRPGAREWFLDWLGREQPALLPRYEQLYRRGAYVTPEYKRRLAERVGPLLVKHGLDGQGGGTARGVPGDQEQRFPTGTLPASGEREARYGRSPEQLTLI